MIKLKENFKPKNKRRIRSRKTRGKVYSPAF